jgi:hypothetical protein
VIFEDRLGVGDALAKGVLIDDRGIEGFKE